MPKGHMPWALGKRSAGPRQPAQLLTVALASNAAPAWTLGLVGLRGQWGGRRGWAGWRGPASWLGREDTSRPQREGAETPSCADVYYAHLPRVTHTRKHKNPELLE